MPWEYWPRGLLLCRQAVIRLGSPLPVLKLLLIFPTLFFPFHKEIEPVFQVQPTTPLRGSSCWYPVPTIHMRYMTFFCLCAKGRWLLFQPFSAENLQYLHSVPSAHPCLCIVYQSPCSHKSFSTKPSSSLTFLSHGLLSIFSSTTVSPVI